MTKLFYNSLTIQGEPDVIRQIRDGFKSENCFEAVIGKDETIFIYSEIDHNLKRYGTLWDVHFADVKEHLDNSEDNQIMLTLYFDTALSPPISFVQIMCAMYKVHAQIKYVEMNMDFAGEYHYGPNGILHKNRFDGHEAEYRLFPEVLFNNIDNFVFLDAFKSGLSADELIEERLGFMSDQDKARVRSEYEEYLLSQSKDT